MNELFDEMEAAREAVPEELAVEFAEEYPDLFENLTRTGTAAAAKQLLLQQDPAYYDPTGSDRANIHTAFAIAGITIMPNGYDLIRLNPKHQKLLKNYKLLSQRIKELTLIEIKATNRKICRPGNSWHKLWFSIPSSERFNAMRLGEQYKFLFVNTVFEEVQELSFLEVLSLTVNENVIYTYNIG
jgi:hypothetical protein